MNYLTYLTKYGYSNISENELRSEIERYRNLGKDDKTLDFITGFLLVYGISGRPWTFEHRLRQQ